MEENKQVDYGEETYFLPEAEQMIKDALAARNRPHNRQQRRALMKKLGKKGREQYNELANVTTKLDYIDLIQKLRQLNEKKEKENNGQATED